MDDILDRYSRESYGPLMRAEGYGGELEKDGKHEDRHTKIQHISKTSKP